MKCNSNEGGNGGNSVNSLLYTNNSCKEEGKEGNFVKCIDKAKRVSEVNCSIK